MREVIKMTKAAVFRIVKKLNHYLLTDKQDVNRLND